MGNNQCSNKTQISDPDIAGKTRIETSLTVFCSAHLETEKEKENVLDFVFKFKFKFKFKILISHV